MKINTDQIEGVGLGYRSPHHDALLRDTSATKPKWLEVLADNFLHGGIPLKKLKSISERYPTVLHCVGSNIAGIEGPDFEYLRKLKILSDEIGAHWISDHLCWSRGPAANHFELLPLPYNEELLKLCTENIQNIQEAINAPLVVENLSAYHSFVQCELSEAEFLNELHKRTGCELLLDVNNIIVNANNLSIDALDFLTHLKNIPVKQIHVAGHRKDSVLWVDDHGSDVGDETLMLLNQALLYFPNTPVLLEWDNNIPDYESIKRELGRIQEVL